MKKSVVTLIPFIMSLCAAGARADEIVIPFSGSGMNGTIAPGFQWFFIPPASTNLGQFQLPFGAIGRWPPPPVPGGITDFTIAFTGLPAGVTIGLGGSSPCDGTRTAFCVTGTSGGPWTPVLGNSDTTITFTAPPGVSLNTSVMFFANVFFNGFTAANSISSVTFTGGWSSPVPEPRSLPLLGTLIGLCAIGGWRARRCLASHLQR